MRGECIANSDFGGIFLALNATTGEIIVAKQIEISPTASDREETSQTARASTLKTERETLKDLDHPNIIEYLGYEETPRFWSM